MCTRTPPPRSAPRRGCRARSGRAAAAAVHTAERIAERHLHLILAERGLRPPVRAGRTRWCRTPPTCRDRARAPPGDDRRVVYLGHLSPGPGHRRHDRAGRAAAPARHHGGADRPGRRAGPGADRARAGGRACCAGAASCRTTRPCRWCDGALAGLSLLHDEPNFRHSLPTKVVEYMARGVPVVTTPLPAAADLVTALRMRLRGAVRRPARGGGRGAQAGRGYLAAGEDGQPRA